MPDITPSYPWDGCRNGIALEGGMLGMPTAPPRIELPYAVDMLLFLETNNQPGGLVIALKTLSSNHKLRKPTRFSGQYIFS